MQETLFTPFDLGGLSLKNRFVMSPMTRSRCPDGGAPTEINARYYAQRAEAGLIIVEATRVSEQGTGYVWTPGVFTEEQVEGWRLVTDAVHEAGSKIFCQLWHVGRVSNVLFQPGGAAPVAPSAIKSPMTTFGPDGPLETSMPRALETDEIPGVVAQFRHAAEHAKRAGFDGVEIHAANGYLIEQFLLSGSNDRTDQYGGSIANRTRFLFEVVEAVKEVWPAERIGVRLAPQNEMPAMGMSDPDREALFEAISRGLGELGVGFLDIGEFFPGHPMLPEGVGITERWAPRMKQWFGGAVMINGGLTAESAEAALNDYADLASFGIPFLANPDLPTRVRLGAEQNTPRFDRFYGGDETGYTDYPRWEETLGAELAAVTAKFTGSLPAEKLQQMQTVMQRVHESGIDKQALKQGDAAPAFTLPDADGEAFSLPEALDAGPVVVSFYRGGWCPYCNLELRALHRLLPEMRESGATLVAISPELPDHTSATREEQELGFPVLSDVGNRVAREFGLVFELDDELKGMYREFGIDLKGRNGDDSQELPVPATYVIDAEGTIQYAFASADHSKRAEPTDVVAALKRLAVPVA